ncbi:MAG: hypothetical protein HY315_04795, partial [Acidobacteria bacterium]|nr:hypothetical protein [Acidobacteriota bacterium]
MGAKRTASFLFFLSMLLAMPLGLARSVVLGGYYYPKAGNRWVERGSKTEFQKGDSIIVMDDRVTLGYGSVPGLLPYQLVDADALITEGTQRLNPSELPIPFVSGGNPAGNEGPPGAFAMTVLIAVDSGSIGARFVYFDPDAKGGGGIPQIIDTVDVSGLATIVSSGAGPGPGPGQTLSVQASLETVLSNSLFTLTGSLDSVSYSILQPTTIALTAKATVPSPGGGVAVDPASGAVTVTGGRSVTFKAPGVAGSAAHGTLVFTIQATFSDGTKSNV